MSTLDRHDWLSVWCRLRVPKAYHASPVLSHLASQYGLAVRITAARLDVKGTQDGWFDLGLTGQPYQLLGGLRYLKHLQVGIAQLGPRSFLETCRFNIAPDLIQQPILATTTVGQSGDSDPGHPGLYPHPSRVEHTCEVALKLPIQGEGQSLLFDIARYHGVVVNIAGALLEANTSEAGRFDVVLSGTYSQVISSLTSLQKYRNP